MRKVDVEYNLPWPPSVNHYWVIVALKGGGRKVLGKKGRIFRAEIKDLLKGVEPMKGPLAIQIDAYPPDLRKRDLDNLLKATLDALEHAGAYLDDNQFQDIRIIRRTVEKGGRLQVTLRSL